VLPGATNDLAGEIQVDGEGVDYTASSPSWKHDGSALMLVAGTLLTVPASGGYGQIPYGWRSAGLCVDPEWSPVDERALYVDAYGGGIWMARPDGQTVEVIPNPGTAYPQDPAWLPDGSGFVYTLFTTDQTGVFSGRNLFLHRFADRSSVQLTQLHNENVEDPVVSPDGRYVAFLRCLSNNLEGQQFRYRRELWVMALGNPALMWPVAAEGNPQHPDWSRANP